MRRPRVRPAHVVGAVVLAAVAAGVVGVVGGRIAGPDAPPAGSLAARLTEAGIAPDAFRLPPGWAPAAAEAGRPASVELGIGVPADHPPSVYVPRSVVSADGVVQVAPADVAGWLARQPEVTVEASSIVRRSDRQLVLLRYRVRSTAGPALCPHAQDQPGCRPVGSGPQAPLRALLVVQEPGTRWVLDVPEDVEPADELLVEVLGSAGR